MFDDLVYDENYTLPLKITMQAVHAVSTMLEAIKVEIMIWPFRYILFRILSSNKVGNSNCRVLERTDAIPMPTGLTRALMPMTVVNGIRPKSGL